MFTKDNIHTFLYVILFAVLLLLLLSLVQFILKPRLQNSVEVPFECESSRYGCCPNSKIPRKDIRGSNC